MPGLAFLLAFGRPSLIDPAYLAVIWLFTGLGAWWLARFAIMRGYPAWFGLAFAIVPATLISMDRLTVDVALASCCVGFALYVAQDSPGKLYAVLALAGLARETGLLLPVAYCIYLASERRWRPMLIFSTSVLPALAWYVYLCFHTPPGASSLLTFIPFSGLIGRILHPYSYPFDAPVRIAALAFDLLALAGILTGVAWAGWRALHRTWNPVTMAVYLFALLTIVVAPGEPWAEVFAFGRTLTPLVLLAALDGLNIRSLLPACGLLLIDPRIGLQFGPQVLNVLRGLFR